MEITTSSSIIIRSDQINPLQRPSPMEFKVREQGLQGLAGSQQEGISSSQQQPPALRPQQQDLLQLSYLQMWPSGLTRNPLLSLYFLMSKAIQASQFSPLVGPQYPLQQPHFPISCFPQQYLPVVPNWARSPLEFLILLASAYGVLKLSFLLVSTSTSKSDSWNPTHSRSRSSRCLSRIWVLMTLSSKGSEHSLQVRGFFLHRPSCSVLSLKVICMPQPCAHGTLRLLMILLQTMEGLRVRWARQQGQGIWRASTVSAHSWHMRWPQHMVSMALRAISEHTMQSSSSFPSIFSRQLFMINSFFMIYIKYPAAEFIILIN